MSYSGFNSTPPRSALVILGGILAWIGLWAGVFVCTPAYHRSLSMGDHPIEMTWDELVTGPPPIHGHLRLVEVQLSQQNPAELFDDVGEDEVGAIDPDDLEFTRLQSSFLSSEAIIEDAIVVAPLSQSIADTPARVIVASYDDAFSAAYNEVGTSNTLTGLFSLNRFHIDGHAITEDENADEIWHYRYEPIDGVQSSTDAMTWFAISFAGVAIGLVICGAGGPSMICCFFFQAPSMLSLLGYPLRYRRGCNFWRSIYAFVGIAGITYGYQSLFVDGRLGQVDGVLLNYSLGFIQMSVGSAALLGAIVNFTVSKLGVSLETSASKSVPKPKMTFDQACGMMPSDSISSRPYRERSAGSMTNQAIPDPIRSTTERYVESGFSMPQTLVWKTSKSQSHPVSIQIGCEGMVIVETGWNADEPSPRLISVLQDGLTIITLPPDASESDKRFGSAGLYITATSAGTDTMLAEHLQTTINMAEKRGTAVIAIDESEVVSICLMAHRVLAAVQTQYGEAHFIVDPARYGRFAFPPQPITVAELV